MKARLMLCVLGAQLVEQEVGLERAPCETFPSNGTLVHPTCEACTSSGEMVITVPSLNSSQRPTVEKERDWP